MVADDEGAERPSSRSVLVKPFSNKSIGLRLSARQRGGNAAPTEAKGVVEVGRESSGPTRRVDENMLNGRIACGAWLALNLLAGCVSSRAQDGGPRRMAAIVTEYRHNSHADVIVSRLLLTDTLDGRGRELPLRLVSLYTDQKPAGDISRLLAASHRFPINARIADALTLGTGRLAVDGVLLVAEHGDYPVSTTGNHRYPKRRFWDETIEVFRRSGKVVPVFIDKHLSDNWKDARRIYDTARELKVPLMAGSSLPVTWRHPPADVERGARLSEVVGITYGTTDAYGFHGLEAVQALAEQRRGGETGVRAVQCLLGPDVWRALDEHKVDPDLFRAALARVPGYESGKTIERKDVKLPKLMIVHHIDGLRVHLFELNDAAGAWTAAWRDTEERSIISTEFWTQEARPAGHFGILVRGIEQMMITGKPAWPVERTLLTSGTLNALLLSQTRGGALVETPELRVAYQPIWRWRQPPAPPPGRPWAEQ
jgi:hypothetical protein